MMKPWIHDIETADYLNRPMTGLQTATLLQQVWCVYSRHWVVAGAYGRVGAGLAVPLQVVGACACTTSTSSCSGAPHRLCLHASCHHRHQRIIIAPRRTGLLFRWRSRRTCSSTIALSPPARSSMLRGTPQTRRPLPTLCRWRTPARQLRAARSSSTARGSTTPRSRASVQRPAPSAPSP